MDVRVCQQCGAHFTPRREHARFCSVRCRTVWNRDRLDDPVLEVTALRWSLTAMTDAIELLPKVQAGDRPSAFAAIVEAVWCVTIVDATLIRHHPGAYDAMLADQTPEDRRRIEGTLSGLRFVRNQIGHDVEIADLIESGGQFSDWTWASVSRPNLASLSERAKAWEMMRYRAYRKHLVGLRIREVLERAAAFLKLASDHAIADIRAHAAY